MAEKIVLGILAVLFVVAIAVVVVGLQAFALGLAWAWFVVPVFGLSDLTFWQAVGAVMILNMIGGVLTVNRSKGD